MTTISWTNGVSGDWSTSTDWSTGTIPGIGDVVTIDAAGSYTITINSAQSVGNLTLNAAGATLSDNSRLTLGGTLTLQAGTLALNTNRTVKGGTIVATGGTLFANGGGLDGVTYEGTLDLSAASANLALLNNVLLTGSGGSGPGVVNLTGDGASLNILNSMSISSAMISIGAPNLFATVFVQGSGTQLTLGSGVTVVETDLNAQLVSQSISSIVNQGLISAGVNGGDFNIGGKFTNQGSIVISNGDTLFLPANFVNLSGSVLTGGFYEVDANSILELNSDTTLVTDNADITLSGTASVIESLNSTTTLEVSLDTMLGTIETAGALRLLQGRNFSSSLDFTDKGRLQLGGGTFGANSLGIATGGVVSGNGTVAATLANSGTVDAQGGLLTLGSAVSGTGTLAIDAGATLAAQSTVGTGETVTFGGAGATLRLADPFDFAGSAINFSPGETIDLVGVSPASVGWVGGTLNFTVTGHAPSAFSLGLAGAVNVQAVDDGSGGAAVTALCFCAGTGIATPSGDVPVEALSIGDMVLTARGQTRPIVWIGTSRIMVPRGRRSAATPVIVRKGALANNVPHHDLRVTKGHSLWLDGALIPVEFLVNHRSILWDDHAQEVAIYHVELETHDVLLANGAPAESYRDDGNRWLFANANPRWDLPRQPSCAPVLIGGPIVDAAWRRLLDRAGPRPGVPLTDDPDLHLLVDGRRLDAVHRRDGALVFRITQPPRDVRVVSRAAVPSELGLARDERLLGVALRRVVVGHAAWLRVVEADDPALTSGFHLFEAVNGLRWTDGDAALPEDLFAGFAGGIDVELQVGCVTRYLPLEAARNAA